MKEEESRRSESIAVIDAVPQPKYFVESVDGGNIGENHRILDQQRRSQADVEMEEHTRRGFRNQFQQQFKQNQQRVSERAERKREQSQRQRQPDQIPETKRLDSEFSKQQQRRLKLVEEQMKNIKQNIEMIDKCPSGKAVKVGNVRANNAL